MRAIRIWVFATFILCFLVIIAGGIVRTTQSGMGCPDWPRCFGSWIPPTNASQLPADFEKYLSKQQIDHTFNVYHTWVEYFNRLLGALLGLFGIIQLVIIYRKKTELPSAFRLAVAFLGLVILTGLFGALVVKLNLSDLSITVHLVFALALTLMQLGLFMQVTGRINRKTSGTRVRRALVILLGIILVQIFLGTFVRIYVDEISKSMKYEQREAWLAQPPIAFLIHRAFALFVFVAVFYTANFCRKVTSLRPHFRRLMLIILLSITTGVILFYLDMPAVAQPLHLLLAILALTQTAYMLLYTKNTTDLLKDTGHSRRTSHKY